jgi:hypothetical protein
MYLRIKDGGIIEYPFPLGRLRNENPNTSFPREMAAEMLAEYGIYPVASSEQPETTLTQYPVEQTPELVNGVWTQVWAMADFSPEEVARRQQKEADAAHAAAVKADAFVQTFVAMTPAEVSDYVNANTGTLAQTRALLNKMALMLLALARREYR